MKLLWRLAGATLCCVLIIKLLLVVEFISFTSIITQDRLRQQFLRQFRSRDGHWNNSFSRSSDSRSSDPLLRLFKNSNAARLGVVKKASETVIPCNVTDYPMGVAVGTLVRVLKENGSSGKRHFMSVLAYVISVYFKSSNSVYLQQVNGIHVFCNVIAVFI